MGVKLLLQTMLVLLFIEEAFAQNWSVALPGCQERCGSLEIIYPFGIGKNCAFDDNFEIFCNKSFTPPKPFLRDYNYDASINLEVLNISLEVATFVINYPITTDCMNTSSAPDVYLPERFTFSNTENRFIAMGCDNLALLTSGAYTTAGCVSLCDNSSLKNDNKCFGINCCQTSFGWSASNIRPSLTTTSRSSEASARCSEGPRYGFIVDQDWFGKLKDICSVRTINYKL